MKSDILKAAVSLPLTCCLFAACGASLDVELLDQTIATDSTPPSEPTHLQAKSVWPWAVDLKWDASSDDTGVTQYRVYQNGVLAATSDETAFQATGLSPQSSYEFRVSALDSAGNESPLSAPLTETTSKVWYIRTDGGTSTQCTGTSDAAYPGTGTNQPCALEHPFWLLPPRSSSETARTALLQGGDAVVVGPGEYKIGYGAPNTAGKTSVCATHWAYDCTMQALPGGPDAAHPTRVLGKGWESPNPVAPQFYGVERAWQVLSLKGNNIELRNLEITDHSSCGYNSPDPVKRCNRGSYPFGDHADDGIVAKDSSNVLLQNVNIHGMSVRGIKAGRISDWTLDHVTIRGNMSVGWDGDIGHGAPGSGSDSSNSGNIIFKHVKIEYNGCAEKYPSGDIWGCCSQDQGCYGDGLGTYFTGGNWIFEDSEISRNTSDGLDLLYHSGEGRVTIRRSRFEGNAGNAVKVATDTFIDNSVIVSNCDYFSNNPIAEQGGDPTYFNQAGFNNCRATGTAFVAAGFVPGRKVAIANSFLSGTSTILIETKGSTCDGSEKFISRNNVFVGMEGWFKKTHGEPGVYSTLFYRDGSDGNGTGPCGTGPTATQFDNRDSVAFRMRFNQCPNSNNVLCVDPLVSGIPPGSTAADIHTYGERWDVRPLSESPLLNKTSTLPGTVLIDDFSIPWLDISGNSRSPNSITWGPQ